MKFKKKKKRIFAHQGWWAERNKTTYLHNYPTDGFAVGGYIKKHSWLRHDCC